ncbi:MAG TPA: hypothetical protein VGJ75_20895 [Dongiaceae bacterium]|jgi:hypothetical protein
MMRTAARSALLSTCVVLAACTTPMFTMPPGPHDYRVGFHDGCDAGYAYAGSPFYAALDTAPTAPAGEPYRSGWQLGFNRCSANYRHIQETVNFLLGPPL